MTGKRRGAVGRLFSPLAGANGPTECRAESRCRRASRSSRPSRRAHPWSRARGPRRLSSSGGRSGRLSLHRPRAGSRARLRRRPSVSGRRERSRGPVVSKMKAVTTPNASAIAAAKRPRSPTNPRMPIESLQLSNRLCCQPPVGWVARRTQAAAISVGSHAKRRTAVETRGTPHFVQPPSSCESPSANPAPARSPMTDQNSLVWPRSKFDAIQIRSPATATPASVKSARTTLRAYRLRSAGRSTTSSLVTTRSSSTYRSLFIKPIRVTPLG